MIVTDIDAVLIDSIRTRGFAVIPNLIGKDDIAVLKPLLEQAIQDDIDAWQGSDYANAWMVYNLMLRGIPFAKLLENERIQHFFTGLLGDSCILYAYTSSSMPPAGGTNFSRRIHVDCPRLIPGYISNVGLTLALDDFTEENGATYLMPGSYTRESPPSEEDFQATAERAYPRAGDGIIFNARTWHRGGINMTPAPRHAVTMNVCRSYMRQQFDFPRMVGPEILDHLGETGRRFLGFNVRVPASLDEYYLPEAERLYKSGQG